MGSSWQTCDDDENFVQIFFASSFTTKMKTRKTFSYSTMNLSMSVCVFDAVSHFDSHAVRFCVLFSSLQILFYNVYGDGASLYLCLCFVCPVLRFVFMITFLRSVRYVCNWYNIWNLLFFALWLFCVAVYGVGVFRCSRILCSFDILQRNKHKHFLTW